MTTIRRFRLNAGGTIDRFTFTRQFANFRKAGTRIDHFHFHSVDVDFPLYPPAILSEWDMNGKKLVRIEDRADRWRFTCPNGHRTWEPTNHHFWCASCARADGVDGVFDELRDQRDGGLLQREDVRLMTQFGPYDRDLDQGADV